MQIVNTFVMTHSVHAGSYNVELVRRKVVQSGGEETESLLDCWLDSIDCDDYVAHFHVKMSPGF